MKFKSVTLFEEKRAKTMFFKQIAFSEFFERKELLNFQLPETKKNVYESFKNQKQIQNIKAYDYKPI
jgi:hypothetical protein